MSIKYDVPVPIRALVDVLVTWRNSVFHELTDNLIASESRRALIDHALFIQANYHGLVVTDLASKAESGADLTFKEASSLISAAHKFVEVVDAAVLDHFDQRAFCLEAISDALDSRSSSVFASKFLKLNGDQRRRFVRNWLSNAFVFAEVPEEIVDACATLSRSERPR